MQNISVTKNTQKTLFYRSIHTAVQKCGVIKIFFYVFVLVKSFMFLLIMSDYILLLILHWKWQFFGQFAQDSKGFFSYSYLYLYFFRFIAKTF